MKHLPIALQVYSIREDAAGDFRNTMQEIKDMGYDGVELAGLYNFSPEEVRRILDDIGLPAVSAHVPYEQFTADLERTIDDYITIGCQYIAIPYLVDDLRPGTDNFGDVIKTIDRIGRVSG
jgi:sugar phosphate isomerase/epimerase